MNHYPDNYHGYGQNATDGQGMAHGYRGPSAMPYRGQVPNYGPGNYPMGLQHQSSTRGTYGQVDPATTAQFGASSYPHHYGTAGHMTHHHQQHAYYNTHSQVPPSNDGLAAYNHIGRMGAHQVGSRGMPGSADYSYAAPMFPGQASTRMSGHLQQQQVPVPPHPMRQTNAQQNPQEVADNILQMASAYPSNQTVQVPLKNRPAPYHIPRSPHYPQRPDIGQHNSPSPHHYQHQSSPVTPLCQTSSSPVSASGVCSPNPNPAPPCGGNQRPSSHGNFGYSGQVDPQVPHFNSTPVRHVQHHHPPSIPQQTDPPHYTHHMSPYSPQTSSSTSNNHLSSPCPNPMMTTAYTASSPSHIVPGPTYSHNQAMPGGGASNPLMSLEKLVMLPETQVVDPKSVVNDACLTSSQQSEEGPKNVEDPAEEPAESSGFSVGCSVPSSSHAVAQSSGLGAAAQQRQTVPNKDGTLKAANGSATATEEKPALVSSQESGSVSSTYEPVDASVASTTAEDESAVSCAQKSGPLLSTNEAEAAPKSTVEQNLSSQEEGLKSNVHNLESGGLLVKNPQESIDNTSSVTAMESGQDFHHDSSPDKSVLGSSALCSQVERGEQKQSVEAITLSCPTDASLVDMKTQPEHCHITQENATQNLKVEPKFETDPSSNLGTLLELGCEGSDYTLLKPGNELADEKEMKAEENVGMDTNCDSEQSDAAFKASDDDSDLVENHIMFTALPKDEPFDSPVSILSTSNSSCAESPIKQYQEKILRHGDVKVFPQCPTKISPKDLKVCVIPCKLPSSVLSEVPINGVAEATVCADNGGDEVMDHVDVIHSRVFSGFKKLGFSRRALQMSPVIPCSIAVGANDQAACERFAVRRTNVGRVTRNSHVRNRSNSTGNTDSDESLENISKPAFIVAKGPQDGARKRGPGSTSKRNGFNKTALNGVASSTKSVNSNKTFQGTVASRENNRHDSFAQNGGSDEEPCYYEGVDNSLDVYLNTLSSDESSESTKNETSDVTKQHGHVTCSNYSSVKRHSFENVSPGKQKSKRDTKNVSNLLPINSEKQEAIEKDEHSPPVKKRKSLASPSISSDVIDLTIETDSPPKQSVSPRRPKIGSATKFKPAILSKRTFSSTTTPIVVLDKSTIVSPKLVPFPKEKSSDLNASEGSTPQNSTCANLPDTEAESAPPITLDTPKAELSSLVKEESTSVVTTSVSVLSQSVKPVKRRRKRKDGHAKSKRKVGEHAELDSDVKESFKAMKFGRTLDLIKSSKKRESKQIGPFVRVEGSRTCPKNVCVYAQVTSDVLNVGKQGVRRNLQGGTQTVTTFHVGSDYTTRGPSVVPLTKTVSLKPWVCAFCGRQSSYKILGDLFGPYFKESEVALAEKVAVEESKKTSTPVKEDTHNSPGKRATQSTSIEPSSRKGKRKSSSKTKVVEDVPPPHPEEFWVHLSCALWSPGVCLVGSKMYGLEEAVNDAALNVCSVCKSAGAIIGCHYKGCSMKYHFYCAVEEGCHMDEENFSILCPNHKEKKLGIASTSQS